MSEPTLRRLLEESAARIDPAPPAYDVLRRGAPAPRRWGRAVLGAAAAVVLIGAGLGVIALRDATPPAPAGNDAVTPVPLVTSDWTPGQGGDEAALVPGFLTWDPRGCVGVAASRGSFTVVAWPQGWTASVDGDQRLTLFDADGTIVARGGDSVSAGGGVVEAPFLHGGDTPLATCGSDDSAFAVQSEVTVTPSTGAVEPYPLTTGTVDDTSRTQTQDGLLDSFGAVSIPGPLNGIDPRLRFEYPEGWTATLVPGSGLVLRDPDGQVVARSGQLVRVTTTYRPTDTLVATSVTLASGQPGLDRSERALAERVARSEAADIATSGDTVRVATAQLVPNDVSQPNGPGCRSQVVVRLRLYGDFSHSRMTLGKVGAADTGVSLETISLDPATGVACLTSLGTEALEPGPAETVLFRDDPSAGPHG